MACSMPLMKFPRDHAPRWAVPLVNFCVFQQLDPALVWGSIRPWKSAATQWVNILTYLAIYFR